MSRLDRLKEYANPMNGQQKGRLFGSASDQKNISEWIERATANSQIAPRASDGEMKLPSTKQTTRDTAMRPFQARKIDKLMKGADPGDKNSVGSSFMKNVRRGG